MEFDNGLEGLLQKSEELTANLNDGTDLPRVRRNLGQILNAGKRLWSKTAAHGTDAQQVKAALFLGQKGLEIADVPDRLKNLATTRNLEPLNPVVHTDIEGFLRNEHENAILSGYFAATERKLVEGIFTKGLPLLGVHIVIDDVLRKEMKKVKSKLLVESLNDHGESPIALACLYSPCAEFKTFWHCITEEDAFSHPWPVLKAFELQSKQMEAKLDVMIDMYSNVSLQEWMSAIINAKLSNEAAARAVSWVKMNVNTCSTDSLLDFLSYDDKIAEKLMSSEKKTRKDIERVPTPSTIRSFSTDVDEDKVGVSKPEGKNDHEKGEMSSINSDTMVETLEDPSIFSVIDMLTNDLLEFADIGDASEISDIEKQSETPRLDENNNKEFVNDGKDMFSTEKAAQKLWDLLKILHDKVADDCKKESNAARLDHFLKILWEGLRSQNFVAEK